METNNIESAITTERVLIGLTEKKTKNKIAVTEEQYANLTKSKYNIDQYITVKNMKNF